MGKYWISGRRCLLEMLKQVIRFVWKDVMVKSEGRLIFRDTYANPRSFIHNTNVVSHTMEHRTATKL